jgi:DNA-directed RNA polymerase sigma subunit (sigma70/sigma32)
VIPHGSRAPEDVPPDESCVLDLVDEGLQTLDRIGQIFGLTRERIRQIELDFRRRLRFLKGST